MIGNKSIEKAAPVARTLATQGAVVVEPGGRIAYFEVNDAAVGAVIG